MEREGMVLSERDGSGKGLPRRWYSITAFGEAYLKTWAGSLARYGEVIDLPLAFTRGPRARPEARREVKTQVSYDIGRGYKATTLVEEKRVGERTRKGT
jgi:DNA-binding PadR family transcriptional regulator